MNSIKQGFDWLAENELKKRDKNDTAIIATNCIEPMYHYKDQAGLPVFPFYSRFYQKNEQDWDYAIYYGRFLDKEQLVNGYFPSDLAIHIIEADGVPLCAILKNDPERNGFNGITAARQKDSVNAMRYLSAAAKKYPKDMEVWTNLALQYFYAGDGEKALQSISNARSVSTLDVQTEMTAGEIALATGDVNMALQVYGGLIENYPTFGNGYLGLAKAQALQGNFDLAVANVNTSNEMATEKQDGQLMQQGYMTLAFIYQRKGDMATAQKYYQAAQGIR
jgi:tetratricopeptide (TPR) repeat protein